MSYRLMVKKMVRLLSSATEETMAQLLLLVKTRQSRSTETTLARSANPMKKFCVEQQTHIARKLYQETTRITLGSSPLEVEMQSSKSGTTSGSRFSTQSWHIRPK